MKNTIIILSIVLSAVSLKAQNYLTIKNGVSLGNFIIKSTSGESENETTTSFGLRTGFATQFSYEYNMSSMFGIAANLGFRQTGGTKSLEGETETLKIVYGIDYLNAGVDGIFFKKFGKIKPYFLGGVRADVPVNYDSMFLTQKSKFNKVLFGYNAGAGLVYDFGALSLSLNYKLFAPITNMNKSDVSNTLTGIFSNNISKVKSTSHVCTVGISIPLQKVSQ